MISVIIPALNEATYLPCLLDDLTRQNFHDFEVIVADSHSDDETAEIAERYRDTLPLQVIWLKQRGAAYARNQAASHAQGDFLLFLDADVRLPSSFLATFWQAQQEHDADFMSTHFRADGRHLLDKLIYFLDSEHFRRSFKTDQPLASGCVIFVRTSLHERLNGFDETRKLGEDIDYSQRLSAYDITAHFVKGTKLKASNRRFRRDGRLSMLMWHLNWVTNDKLARRSDEEYRFGHYED